MRAVFTVSRHQINTNFYSILIITIDTTIITIDTTIIIIDTVIITINTNYYY